MAAISIGAISIGAISMAICATVAPPAAQAGFLYVPQHETAPRTFEAAGSKAAEPADERVRGRMLEGSGGEGAGLWNVQPGEMLRAALSRWGGHRGVEVVFLTDRRYRLHEARTFAGSFEEAARALFSALSHLPHPPVGEMRADGRTYAVTHRAGGQRESLRRASPLRTGGGQ